jgi:dihydroorotate dehydrogenase (fumarate)
MDLRTKYMGIELSSPIIVGACNLVSNLKNLKKMQDAGAGAIVYRSLFEEQLHLENLEMSSAMDEFNNRNAEFNTFMPEFEHAGPKEYLAHLAKAKSVLDIPLFASINAVYEESWVEYAKKIENVGVDGIELNLYVVPSDMDSGAFEALDWQIEILKKIKKAIDIPVAVKLSPYYSNPLHIIKRMEDAGAEGFVLFNRFFQPDIDLESEKLIFPYNLSSENDYRLAMRFAGLLYKNVDASICASGGIFTGYDAAKLILAGADSVQVVSTLYKNGLGQINLIISQLKSFMESKGYETLDDFRGKLSKANLDDPFAYNRAQYIDVLLNSRDIFKNYPMV